MHSFKSLLLILFVGVQFCQAQDTIKDQFTCVHRGRIEAKNKGEIDMYFVE